MEVTTEGQHIPWRQSHSAPSSPAVTPPKSDLEDRAANVARGFQRRVSFPDDEFIVTSYLEPPIPWVKSDDMCSSDIIDAYKVSCAKHHVEPIDIVIEQIKKIKDFSKRFKELDLSGKKLNAAHCEALEEIFKRIQFEKLNLELCCLDDEISLAIFDMIEFYEVATDLNVSHNEAITARGWHACSRMLKKTPCLENLDASCTNLNVFCLPIICRALRLGSNLSVLRLDHCNINGSTFVTLVAALKMNTSLSELHLQYNCLSSHDGYQLGSLLRTNIRLKLLNLNSNILENLGVSRGIEGLGDQVVQPNEGLKSLTLKNNICSSECMAAVGAALRKSTSLEYFDLSDNEIKDDGIFHLKDGLMKNRSLVILRLNSCKITCQGAIAIAECIAVNAFIQDLDLTGNDIKLGGCIALSLSMKVNTSITSLKLDLPPDSKTDGSSCEYQQLLNDISNFCIRNNQMIVETAKLEEELLNNKIDSGGIKNSVGNGPQISDVGAERESEALSAGEINTKANNATLPQNDRFQVSLVRHNNPQLPIPRYVSSKTNGRFTVFKVNSLCEECEEPSDTPEALICETKDLENLDDIDNDCVFSPEDDPTADDAPSRNTRQDSPLNKIKEFADIKFGLPTNLTKRRVTIDGSSASTFIKGNVQVKSRRKSTPNLGTNTMSGLSHQNRPTLKLSLNKRLECLDLRSTVPLSPGRVVESCGLPLSSVDAMLKMDETLQVVISDYN